ncbi:hypothetical protein LQZ21_14755 [Treponema sp. TIM-1]|uniref:hypothetical protein n=1 Tax=Treponema sp. TIM-1 TaxID=2898417 RepID=UPI00397EE7EA
MTDLLQIIRQAIVEVIPETSFNSAEPLSPRKLYIPPAHIKSLRLHHNLIIGARGVGKTTWTRALGDEILRAIIGGNIPELKNIKAQIGFSESSMDSQYPSLEIYTDLLEKKFTAYEVWQTVLARWLCGETGDPVPVNGWTDSVTWVRKNPEPWTRLLQKANDLFKSKGINGLIVFDALDRSGNNWEQINEIVRDLLRLAVRLKAYSNIHTKIFLREDQLSRTVTDFPDSSKLLAAKIDLDWYLYDLHGLLWHLLCNAPGEGGDVLRNLYRESLGRDPEQIEDYWVIANEAKWDEATQRRLFEKLAGSQMGRDKRRGVPYIWSVSHLADGKGRTSPRSFLAAIRKAAEDSSVRGGDYPLHYESIKRGVQKASSIRIDEMAEDYPWVRDICEPLENLNVPVEFTTIQDRWDRRYPQGPNSITSKRLPPQHQDQGWIGIQKELIRLGVFTEMRDGRINMPDLYQVGFGLGRRGGVTPINKPPRSRTPGY